MNADEDLVVLWDGLFHVLDMDDLWWSIPAIDGGFHHAALVCTLPPSSLLLLFARRQLTAVEVVGVIDQRPR
jgi:hypothetical protein